MCEKRTSVAPARPRAQSRAQPAKVNEATTGRKNQDRKHPYEARRHQVRGEAEGNKLVRKGNRPLRHNFVMELKDLIVVPNIADRLRPPMKSDKVVGPRKDSWCEFHEAFGHHINNFLALGHQLDELVKNGFLKDYLARPATTAALTTLEEDQAHEMPIHGEEVRGYLELRMTFTDGTTSRTKSIRYLVMNANSAYNILLGRPTLNRLRAVASTCHMKMKLPDLSGRVIVIKSDQEEARKFYENSLKTKRGVFMVLERSPISATPMEVESAEEATPAKATPVEASPAGATPKEDARLEKTPGGHRPWEKLTR